MKKILLPFLTLFLFFSLATITYAVTEQVTSFSSDITLNQDSSYTVTETIVYNFGNNAVNRHGIYRDIPYQYQRNGSNYNVRINITNVTDENNIPYQYDVSELDSNIHIQIGDANQTVSGEKTYKISYTVVRGINYFEDHDELYWNVTGDKWKYPIQQATATVHLPQNMPSENILLACYTGSLGSTASDCSYIQAGNTVSFATKQDLKSFEGLTIVVSIPKGIFTTPSFWQQVLWFMQDNWAVFIPFIIFIFMFYRWYKHGRDPETTKHIAPMYDAPKGMTPSEVGVMVDEHADNKDISATLIDLAVKGYIKIRERETTKMLLFKDKDYELVKLKEADSTLKSFEKTLLQDIFEGEKTKTLSDLMNKFYKTLTEIKKELYHVVTTDGYFPLNPDKVRSMYYGIGIAFIIIGFVIFSASASIPTIIAFALSGLMIMGFGKIMPRKTAKGIDAYIHILGLKLYLSRAEKKQIDFFNAPEKKPEVFEKFLPYAMVLGVETAWAKEFEGIYKNPPNWYEGNMGTFNTFYLIHALNNFSTASQTTFTSTPKSAGAGGSGFGGGFSGGGFGGGGGGSW